jgi:outer membrane protein assembly factor BamB
VRALGRIWPVAVVSGVVALLLLQMGVPLIPTAYAARVSSTPTTPVVQYLPWTAGQAWAVSQGNQIVLQGTCISGCFSHTDAYDRYAWDFYYPPHPAGQPVLAAAPGTVVAVINDVSASSYVPGKGCASFRANEVLIQYADGTYGLYLHLMQEQQYAGIGNNGWVHVGQQVARGQQIGRTGETGCATGYHLHYARMAYLNVNGAAVLESIPSTFADVPGGIPQEGKAYVSGNRGDASQPGPIAAPMPAPQMTPTPAGIEWTPASVNTEATPTPAPLLPGPSDWPTFQHDPARSGTTSAPQLTPGNVTTLAQRWLFSTVPGAVQTAPAIAAHTVFVGLTSGFFYALNLKDGSLRWSFIPNNGMPYTCLSAPDVTRGLVLFTSCNGYLYALSAATGKLIWQYEATRAVSMAMSSAAPADDGTQVYVATADGQISALSLQTGKPVWHVQLTGAVVGSPALADRQLYVVVTPLFNSTNSTSVTDGTVYALDTRTGHTAWLWNDFNAPLTSGPAVSQGILYVGDQQGIVTALSAGAGALLWQKSVGGTITATPAVAASSVYIAAQNGIVAALDPLTGITEWAASLPAALEAAPAVSNGVLFLADNSGMLRALDASNGAQICAQNVGAPSGMLLSSPAIAGDEVVIGGNALFAFGPALTADTTPTPAATATVTPAPTATATAAPIPTATPSATVTPPSSESTPPVTADSADRSAIIANIITVFGPYAAAALAVAECESGYNAFAYNPKAVGNAHAEGVFQILYPSTWNTTPYRTASPYDPLTNIKAAYYIFQRDGYSWREWECQP